MQQSVLITDDNEEVRTVVRRVLERAGYNVHEAGNGKEALRTLRTMPFDLVITDILMPEQDGIETIMFLRREAPQTKVIAISGSENDLFLADARGLGAIAVLAKPFTPNDMLRLVTSVLGGAAARA